MSAIRKLGPYVACLVAGIGSGVGVAYFLYIRLNRQIVEIRKLIRELKQEVDIYSDDNRRGKSNKRPRVQYSLTASSGDDDDDFVDCVAGLTDNAMARNQAEPELVGIRQNVEFSLTDKTTVEMVMDTPTDEQLSPVEEVPDFIENSPLSAEIETEEKDPDAETEMEDEHVP